MCIRDSSSSSSAGSSTRRTLHKRALARSPPNAALDGALGAATGSEQDRAAFTLNKRPRPPLLTDRPKWLAKRGSGLHNASRPRMPEGSRLCPYCRRLNSVDEKTCSFCGKRLPGAATTGLLGLGRDLASADSPVTKLMLAICLGVFALCAASDREIPPHVAGSFHGSSLLRFGALVPILVAQEPWRLLSAVFVHANTLHLLMNGLSLAALGGPAERDFGPARFALVFVLTGVLGFVTSQLWYGPEGPFTVGASGAVFGVLGGAIGERLLRGDPSWKDMLLRGFVYALIMAFLPALGINNAAHMGGLFSGVALGFLLNRLGRRFDRALAGLAVLAVLASFASLWLCNRSDLWRVQRAQEIQAKLLGR
jgi:rhomboid protease GluP